MGLALPVSRLYGKVNEWRPRAAIRQRGPFEDAVRAPLRLGCPEFRLCLQLKGPRDTLTFAAHLARQQLDGSLLKVSLIEGD